MFVKKRNYYICMERLAETGTTLANTHRTTKPSALVKNVRDQSPLGLRKHLGRDFFGRV